MTEAGSRASIGSIVAERAPLQTSFKPRRQPIMITTFGRTGSMLLMRLLSSHPEILSYKPHRFEQRIVSYWIDALLTLSSPVSFLRGVAPQAGADPPHRVLDTGLGRHAAQEADRAGEGEERVDPVAHDSLLEAVRLVRQDLRVG